MNVFELFAKISLDTSGFESGLNQAGEQAKGFGGKVGTAMKVGTAAVAAVGTAVAGATTAFVSSANKVADYGDHIDKMSQKIGISAEAYQEWDAIMQHSGASVDSLRPVMKTLSTQAQKGSEEFKKLGISEQEVANLSKEDLFSKVISGLQGMEEGTERTYIASKLLGRGATELGALLNTSAQETEEMRQKVHELGGVMSDEAVKASAQFKDSLQDLKTGFDGLKRNLMSEFLPGMSTVMDGLSEILMGNTDEGLEIISSGIDDVIAKFTDELPKFLEVASGIIESFLMAIVENLPKIFEAGTSLVMKLIDGIVANLPKIIDAGLKAIIAVVQGIAENIDKLVPAVVEAILLVVQTILDNLPTILDAVLQIIVGVAQGILDAIPVIIEALPKIIEAIVSFIIGAIPQIIEAGIQLLTALVDALPEIITAIVEALPQIIDGIVNGLLDNIDKIIEAGITLLIALVQNLPKIIEGIVEAIPTIITAIVEGFGEGIVKLAEVGVELIKGLWEGIKSMATWIWDKVSGFFTDLWDGIKSFFGIHSPSRKGAWLMEMFVRGMGQGIDKNGKKLISTAEQLNDDIINAFGDGEYDIGASVRMNDIASSRNAFVGSQDGYLGGSDAYEEEIIIPRNQADSGRDLTVILELDRMELARTVYRLNNEERQRVGVQLAGGVV